MSYFYIKAEGENDYTVSLPFYPLVSKSKYVLGKYHYLHLRFLDGVLHAEVEAIKAKEAHDFKAVKFLAAKLEKATTHQSSLFYNLSDYIRCKFNAEFYEFMEGLNTAVQTHDFELKGLASCLRLGIEIKEIATDIRWEEASTYSFTIADNDIFKLGISLENVTKLLGLWD